MYRTDFLLNPIVLKEYGRNVQELVRHISRIPNKEARTIYAKSLMPLMKAVNPSIHNNATPQEKIWHDLFVISDYKLDVDIPYPMPVKPAAQKKSTKIPYIQKLSRHRRYGRNILATVSQVKKIDDPQKKEIVLLQIAKWIRTYHKKYNSVEDIIYYFREVVGRDYMPDTIQLKQRILEQSQHVKKYKRYFKRRKK